MYNIQSALAEVGSIAVYEHLEASAGVALSIGATYAVVKYGNSQTVQAVSKAVSDVFPVTYAVMTVGRLFFPAPAPAPAPAPVPVPVPAVGGILPVR